MAATTNDAQDNKTKDDKDGKTAAPASSLTDKERDQIAKMPYEEARDNLIKAVQALEAGGLNLDQSMHQWEIGEALAKRAQSLLNDVRAKLESAEAEQQSTAATAGTQSNLE
ncbi:exodeoxyribonuclease VII small subunit [Bifidobacterium sp. ESL0798]|uniref:exodeoxyribonuclease VII small subunit n=1 Tax=Bifidobacterium sp. ESL0798 TaxID=2983235 RepID=UPI0023F82898|nr:exodeoxyribonuclease VII small subunit [Bifidobacterium sp. ESL0798]WEV73676.1 exodeoxyribonuclease VII small subunit [Bifidobacterium sp. ESL0798]